MRIFFSVILLGLFSSAVYAENASVEAKVARSISVSGEAEVRIVPDQVIVSMTAISRGKDLMGVREKNDASIKKLVAHATQQMGIDARHVQTDFVNVEPVYRNCNDTDERSGVCSPLEVVYYSVSKGIQVRLKEPQKYEELITKALSLGINKIDDVQFITSELRKHRDAARDMAAKASLEKATAVAQTLGMKVGKPLNISTHNAHHFYRLGARGGNNGMMQNAFQSASAGPSMGTGEGELALGQINVSAQVDVVYELE